LPKRTATDHIIGSSPRIRCTPFVAMSVAC
jgi:hypothetical protein